jgi:CO dehydrogenase/acetyl-CoA synthase beta subunit
LPLHAIISLIPKIIAKSDSDSINSSHSFLDSVHKPILQKIVRNADSNKQQEDEKAPIHHLKKIA